MPANTRHWSNGDLMLQWSNETALAQRLLFAGILSSQINMILTEITQETRDVHPILMWPFF